MLISELSWCQLRTREGGSPFNLVRTTMVTSSPASTLNDIVRISSDSINRDTHKIFYRLFDTIDVRT